MKTQELEAYAQRNLGCQSGVSQHGNAANRAGLSPAISGERRSL